MVPATTLATPVYNAAYTAGKDRGFKSGYNDANGLATLASQATTYTTDTYLRGVYTAGYNAGDIRRP